MVFTLEQLRTFTRSLDERLEDTVAYSDAWIDEKIEEGIAEANDIKQIFYADEKYDLEENFTTDGLTKVEIILQREVQSILSIKYSESFYTVTETNNNHIIVEINPNVTPDDYIFDVHYSYYPILPFTDIELSYEMYKLIKEGIAIACFAYLKDEKSEGYHREKAELFKRTGVFDADKDFLEPSENRIWRGSWA